MDKTKISTPLFVDDWCHTKSITTKFNFKWVIDNFLSLQRQPSETIKSSLFPVGWKHESKWILNVYPKGLSKSDQEHVGVFINLITLPVNESTVYADVTFSLLNNKNEKQKTLSCGYHTFNNSEDWGFQKFITRGMLKNNETGQLLVDGKLIILCEVEILSSLPVTSGTGSINLADIEAPKQTKLSSDLSRLLEDEKYCDVTLVVGGSKIPVHKNILTSRSDVFAAMFEHELEEQKSNRVPIQDIDEDVLREMVHFIYTGEAPNVGKMANSLLVAADRYALNELKVICEQALLLGLSIENAAETLVLADRYSANKLKEIAIDFINCHAKDVIATEDWKNLRDNFPNLVTEAYEALFIN